MLVIRDAQIRAFERAARSRFLTWLEAHTRKYFAQQVTELEPRELRRWLRGAIHRAERFGITESADVTWYVHLELQLGPRFYDEPDLAWAGEILRRTAVPGAAKLRAVSTALSEDDPSRSGMNL